MMLGYILVCITFVSCVYAQEEEVILPNDNKAACISDMVEWCNKMQYPQQDVGMTVLSVAYQDPSGYYRVFCLTDSDGTNCTRNRMPWFSCSPAHELYYKGKILTKDSTDVDDDVCKTAEKAFKELFVQNMSFDNTTLKTELQKGMESFFDQMVAMMEQLDFIQKRLKEIPVFGDPFLPRNRNSTIESVDDNENRTEESNQIEKE